MGINYGRLRSLTARKLISALTKDDFVFDHGVGSHHHYYHPDGRHVTLTFHSDGQTFRLKTLKSMMETQAHWTEADLKRLGLIK